MKKMVLTGLIALAVSGFMWISAADSFAYGRHHRLSTYSVHKHTVWSTYSYGWHKRHTRYVKCYPVRKVVFVGRHRHVKRVHWRRYRCAYWSNSYNVRPVWRFHRRACWNTYSPWTCAGYASVQRTSFRPLSFLAPSRFAHPHMYF